jgi:hypothetical protein
VLIKFDETVDNPSEIEYKTSPDSKVKSAGTNSIKEFGVGEDYRFLRSQVQIDRSSEDFRKMTGDRNPDFKEETLFLRILISGEYSLLSYEDKSIQRFFIQKPSGEIDQLIYKKYTIGDNVIRKNSQYKQQLYNLLKCEDITLNSVLRINYNRRELMKLFSNYHKCKDLEFEVFYSRPKGELNFKAKAGINVVNLDLLQDIYDMEGDLGYSLQPRIGLEMEYIIPMLNRKFTFFTEPSLALYNVKEDLIVLNKSKTESRTITGVYRTNVQLKYTEFELPVGLRFYMFLNAEYTSRLFLSGGASISLVMNSSEIPEDRNGERADFEFEQENTHYYFGGIGYSYNNTFSVEARFYPKKQLTSNFAFTLSHDNSFAIIAGYSLF